MKWRLAIAFLGFTVGVLLIQDLPLVSYLSSVEQNRVVAGLERDSFVLANRAADTLASQTSGFGALQDDLDRYQVATGTHIYVTDAQGVVVADTEIPGAQGTSLINQVGVSQALAGEVATGHGGIGEGDIDDVVYVAVPIMRSGTIYGAILNTYPESDISVTVRQRLGFLALTAGISLALAALVSLRISRRITRAIENLEGTTVDFALGDMNARANVEVGDAEIKSLAVSFNAMADQIARLFEQQRAFSSDASHQLRTPLTALQLRLENASDTIANDPDLAAQRIDSAIEEAERLQMIIEGLLVLSRAESNSAPELLVIDLAEVARERVEGWQALAEDQGVQVSVSAPRIANVRCVSGALEQVIDNFIDNALAVAPHGSHIRVVVQGDKRTTTVHVLDEGPGLPDADLERAFNRFWRARSDKTGTGLGLAIVERLVTVSGGRVRLSNRLPHGLDAQAEFLNA